MAGLTTTVQLADLARQTQAGQGPAAGPLAPPVTPAAPIDPATARVLVQIGVSDIKRRFATGTAPDGQRWRPLKYGRPAGGDKPLSDTGRLANSIAGRSTASAIVWFTNLPGAALLHYGGTVVPKKAKFLSIPLTREAKRAGSPRRVKGSAAVPLFARRVQGRLVGHFLLVKRAVVPARPFMGLSPQALDAMAQVWGQRVGQQWEEGRPPGAGPA